MTIDATEATDATAAEVERERLSRIRRPKARIQVIGVYVALIVLWIVLSFWAPYFLTVQNVTNLLTIASTLSLIGAGLTIVLIAAEIDLS